MSHALNYCRELANFPRYTADQTLSDECLTLASFSRYTANGANVICGTFGTPYADELNPSEKSWNFTIDVHDGDLVLTIDAYTVANEFTEFTPETWDVDAWTDQMIVIEGVPATRSNFYALAQAARALINGRNVIFEDGSVIPAIKRVAQ